MSSHPSSSDGTLEGGSALSASLKFTFVVVTYASNPGGYLTVARALESVLKQTDPACEVIMVNDGQDDTMRLVYKDEKPHFKKRGIPIRYIEAPYRGIRGGHASANVGFNFAQGEFVTVLNGDNIIYPQYVEELYDPNYDVLLHWLLMNDSPGKIVLTGESFVKGYVDRLNYSIRASYLGTGKVLHKMHIDSDYDLLMEVLFAREARYKHVRKVLAEHN